MNRCKEVFDQYPHLSDACFEEIRGKKECFLKTKILNSGGHQLEIFIYADEAGLMIDGKEWLIHEKPDYPSPEQLINSFVKTLNKIISQ